MELSDEQIENIKKQLISQIESSFPEEKKQSAIKEIQDMNKEQLIEFLKSNNLMQESGKNEQKCIFCSMVFGDIPTTKIAETPEALAVLEINPISKGHIIIIPKEHILEKKQVEEKTKELSTELKKIIKNKLKPKKVLSSFSELFQHGVINLVPVYTNENLNSERKQATTQELQEIQKILTQDEEPKKQVKKQKNKKEINEKEINEKNTWLPKRIP